MLCYCNAYEIFLGKWACKLFPRRAESIWFVYIWLELQQKEEGQLGVYRVGGEHSIRWFHISWLQTTRRDHHRTLILCYVGQDKIIGQLSIVCHCFWNYIVLNLFTNNQGTWRFIEDNICSLLNAHHIISKRTDNCTNISSSYSSIYVTLYRLLFILVKVFFLIEFRVKM